MNYSVVGWWWLVWWWWFVAHLGLVHLVLVFRYMYKKSGKKCTSINFLLFEEFQKLVTFLLPIFGNVDGSWRVMSKLRGFTLIQVAQRRSKVVQRFSASLVQVGVVQGVPR